jgi:hypothetical protein
VIGGVRLELIMHTSCPASRYDLSTGNHLGILAVLMVANLSIAMLYYVRIPIEFDFRHVIGPALTTASALLLALSLIFIAWLAIQTQASRLVTVLAIANGLLALTQLYVFLSPWMT